MTNTDILYTPARIGNLNLKNRFIQSAMHTRFASEFGEVSEQIIAYLTERARGGVSMIILENTAVDWEVGRAAGNPVRIDQDVFVSGLSDLTEAIHREGCLIAAQLHHAGRQNPMGNTEGGVGPVAPSAVTSTAIGDEPRALTTKEITAIVAQFAAAARRAVDAGFDMVELHGSHGYLLTQFLSPQSNLRTDEYGGSFENRARFPLEVVKAVREAVGDDYPISYRISLEERTPGGMEADEGVLFCKLIEPYVDVFNVTAATYESMDSIFMMQGVEPGQLLPLAAQVKAQVSKPVIGISRLGWAFDKAAAAVLNEELDFVALARTQLTDPMLVTKERAGEGARVRRCIGCNECVGAFLFKGWRLHCVINPELGQESKLGQLYQIQPRPKRVVVVGGGPSGFEVARAAALRGHQVDLYEAESSLGGQIRTAGKVEFKAREMNAYCDYFQAELDHLGVKVHLGTKVAHDHPALRDADELVLATGGRRETPPPAGAIDAVEALEGGLPLGDIVVLGGNAIGLNVAAFAAQAGAKVWVVTGSVSPGYDVNPILASHTVRLLTELGVEFVEVEPKVEATRVYSPEWVADSTEWAADTKAKVTNVGARANGGRLYHATQSGFWVGTRI